MFDDVVDALREMLTPELWNLGLRLAESGAVRLDDITLHEWTFSVGHPPNQIHSVRWCLGMWRCSCKSLFLKCPHIVAAAVTLKAIGESLAAQPRPPANPPPGWPTGCAARGGPSISPCSNDIPPRTVEPINIPSWASRAARTRS